MERRGHLIALGDGIYTVSEVSRILGPNMTSRKVRYWLQRGILGAPVRPTQSGRPTLLTFEQLLKVRTVQHLRDDLHFSLPRVALTVEELSGWIFDRLFAEEWYELHFYRSPTNSVAVTDGAFDLEVGTGQLLIHVLPKLDAYMQKTREDWVRRAIDIEGFPHLISNARVLGGSPVIRGTRVETSFVAHMTQELPPAEILRLYPYIGSEGLSEALRFERTPTAA